VYKEIERKSMLNLLLLNLFNDCDTPRP
jgi:hypothetical protein